MEQKSSHSEIDLQSKLTLVTLPPEVLKHILSFSTYDKVRIRCVSKTLRCISEIPSLWESFIWLRYAPGDDILLEHVLKRIGKYIKRLHFTDHVASSNLQLMVMLCTNVMHLSLPGLVYHHNFVKPEKTMNMCSGSMRATPSEPGTAVNHSVSETETFKLSSNVKELSISYTSVSQLFDRIQKLLEQWVNLNYVPRKLNVIVIAIERRKEFKYTFTSSRQQSYLPRDVHTLTSSLQWSYLPILSSKKLVKVSELSDTAWLNICFKDSLPDVPSPVVPFIQVQITDSSVALPSVKASDYGLQGLAVDTLHVTQGSYRGKKVHKALLIGGIGEHVDTSVTSLTSITYFDASCCKSLHPHHLEQISLACPNLQKLDLRNNPKCLNSLQGLHSLANNCRGLQGLNLRQTYVRNNEYDCVELWEILCSMHLTQMSIDAQMINIHEEVTRQKLIKMFQKYLSLQVLEMVLESDLRQKLSNDELSLISYFPSVASYRLCNLYDNNCYHALKRIFSSKYLRCLFLTATYCFLPISLEDHSSCLQQLYINSPSETVVTEASVHALCRHGGLEHVILYVKSLSARSIDHIIEYSSNLVTFGVFLYQKWHLASGKFAFTTSEVQELIAILKRKFSKRKLFNGGTFVLNLGNMMANHSLVLNTDLFSVWDSNHLY